MSDKTEYLTARYDELTWQAQHVEPLKRLDIWGQPYDETWGHVRNSYRGEDGAAFAEPDIAAVVHFNQWRPEYVLAQVAALRAVIAEAERLTGFDKALLAQEGSPDDGPPYLGTAFLDALLQPFAGRKDFPAAWRS